MLNNQRITMSKPLQQLKFTIKEHLFLNNHTDEDIQLSEKELIIYTDKIEISSLSEHYNSNELIE